MAELVYSEQEWQARQVAWKQLSRVLDVARHSPVLLSHLAGWSAEEWQDVTGPVLRSRCPDGRVPVEAASTVLLRLLSAYRLGWTQQDVLAVCAAVAPWQDDEEFWDLLEQLQPTAADLAGWSASGTLNRDALETLLALTG